MFEFTELIFDFVFAIILFLCGIAIIPAIADILGLKIIFKIENLSRKEIINKFEHKIKVTQARKRLVQGGLKNG